MKVAKGFEKIAAIVAKRTDADIIKDWVELDKKTVTPEVAEIRGIYLNEIEKRFPDAFDAWTDSDDWEMDLVDFIR